MWLGLQSACTRTPRRIIFKTCMAWCAHAPCIGAIVVITELSPRRIRLCGLQGGGEFDWWCA